MNAFSTKEISDDAHDYIEKWEKEQLKRLKNEVETLKEEEKVRKNLYFRKHLLDNMFEWTPANTQSLKNLNNALLSLYREAYDEMLNIKLDFDRKIEAGLSAYKGYFIGCEVEYLPIDVPEEKRELWQNLCELTGYWGPFLSFGDGEEELSFEEQIGIEDQPRDLLKDILDRNETFSLPDAVNMKKDNFMYQINIMFAWK
ncbi:MAG: hypothetical protein IKO95_08035 [Spirochaetia bacterium]|nr:hypothetical protein [Spirochaetia bacterium]